MCHIQVARFLVPCGNGCCSAFLVHYSQNQIYWSELDKPCVTETKRTRGRAGRLEDRLRGGYGRSGAGPRGESYGVGW